MFASLFITQVIGTIDRRKVVILFSVLLTLSCLLVSFAESFTLLLLGRACLGLGLGGFWAMSASLTMRLVPARTVPKALSVIFGAVSIALVIAAPLGSFLGGIIGWRNVFNAAAVMGVLCIIWVWKALPSLPGEAAHHKQNMFALLKRPGVLAGMTAIFMAFAGQFAFFTYIRPVFMNMAGFDVDGLTLVLLSFGIASFVGTSLSSQFLKRSLKVALAGAPLVLAASAAVLVLWGSDKWVASAIAIIWGFAFALVPVGWSTWITRTLADQAEKAGSIQVAVIQLANTCGAAIGGVALDHLGLTSPLVLSGTLMLLTALLVAGKVVTFTEARSRLKDVLDDVNDNVETTIISRRNGGDAVVMSLQHYNSMMETIHLMSSPANASRLMESIAQANTGKTTQRDLIDDQATDLDR
ncbi:hypothetical protein L1887_45208 [Cichorium endivia]|nr:hypothetical protein L1887_45208 [Cichorium endivia]